jgi:hypothetical protein
VLFTAAGCYLLKLLGLSVPQRVLDRPVVRRVADLIPVALLSALVAVALVCRLPLLVVVVLAAVTAAVLRIPSTFPHAMSSLRHHRNAPNRPEGA